MTAKNIIPKVIRQLRIENPTMPSRPGAEGDILGARILRLTAKSQGHLQLAARD